jgi:hypothetical protein
VKALWERLPPVPRLEQTNEPIQNAPRLNSVLPEVQNGSAGTREVAFDLAGPRDLRLSLHFLRNLSRIPRN